MKLALYAKNFYDGWVEMTRTVLNHGEESAPRGKNVREILGTQLVIEDLQNNVLVHPHRNLNYRFMVAEWLWIEAARNDVATVEKYNRQITQFSDDGEIFNGAYGPRLKEQWPWLIELIKKDPDTRQGVVSIWTPTPVNSKDIPCTLSLQVLLRKRVLHGIVTMRSQDLWLGLPYDFFNFSQMVNGLAGDLNSTPGSLTFNVGSTHVYETNYEQVRRVLEADSQGYHVRSPRLPGRPPADKLLNSESVTGIWMVYRDVLKSLGKFEALRILKEAE